MFFPSPLTPPQSAEHGRVIRFFGWLPTVSGVFVVALAIASLANWNWAVVPIRGSFGVISMPPWAALLFLATGLSLILIAVRDRSNVARALSLSLAIFVIVGALYHALSWSLGRDLGLDLLLFREELLATTFLTPGRLSMNTVISFISVGTSLIAIQVDDRDDGMSAQWFILIAIGFSFLSLIGYAFGVIRSFAFITGTNMALFTAVTMLIASIGIVFTRVERGLPALMTDPGAAGSVTRRLVPAAVLVPFLLGWALVYGERIALFPVPVGVSVYVMLNVAVFLWLVRWAAYIARETDQVRQEMLSREQTAREAAETANLSKSNFLAVMSHELRTPLSAVIGYEELLVDEIAGPINDAQRHQLGRIKASAQHLLDLIDQILSYSRIDAGREELHLEPSSANALADDASNLVEPLARADGLELVVVATENDVLLRTDRSKVRQILVNLLSNAVKFTSEGKVSLTVSPNGSYMNYIVRDSGIGIAPEHLERIFDAFWQVERPSTRRIGGTGLGLSVTRRLARLLGGDVFVESELGRGTAFTVMLPLESVAPDVGLDPNIP